MFETKTAFSLHIEELVRQHECSYTEALLFYAEVTGAEYSSIAEMMSPCLVEKVRIEAEINHHLPKPTTFQIDDGTN
jgi:hypothetical protein